MIQVILSFLVAVILFSGVSYELLHNKNVNNISKVKPSTHNFSINTPTVKPSSPLAIENMREKQYPGSSITIERTLSPGSNYNQYLVSYSSDGLKIYGLLTVPIGQKPKGGWPVILFNHGYIPPESYLTVSSYRIMIDPLASAGFIVFKPDYRGNGNSEGKPSQPYITPNDVTDSMNALASIKKYKDANPQKIGVFGHSMGGNITLHELVITHTFKAAELMAGVVGNEADLANWWRHRYDTRSIVGNDLDTYYVYEKMIQEYGMPTENTTYWSAIDPTHFINFINAPVQIQVGSADEEVPIDFSSSLATLLSQNGKVVDYHIYSGANHNLEPDTTQAMDTAIAFFNKYLK